MNQRKYFTLYDLVMVGVFAAVCFITTSLLSFRIPTPAGQTMIKTANIFCLLAGMVLGGVKGGLAAGIGSFLYDLTDPAFISSAPFTLINFFMMGFVCGLVFHLAEKSKSKPMFVIWSVVAGLSGQAVYIILLFAKRIGALMLAGDTFTTAWVSNLPRLATSLINMTVAVPCAAILAPIVIAALKKANVYQKITKNQNKKVRASA